MWLEGASQNGWSVADMRRQRSTTLGLVDAPSETTAVAEEWDDDADAPATDATSHPREVGLQQVRDSGADEPSDQEGDHYESDDYKSDHDGESASRRAEPSVHDSADEHAAPEVERSRPFADLPSLPADLTDAFESFKLCVLRHKMAGWREVSRDAVLLSLDALKELAVATAG